MMPIVRKAIAQDCDDVTHLRIGSSKRFVFTTETAWSIIFSPNAVPEKPAPVVKVWAQFDSTAMDKIKLVAYLYDKETGSVAAGGICEFDIWRVNPVTGWKESLVQTVLGSFQPDNSFYYAEFVPPFDMRGDVTLMVESRISRLAKTHRDRVYVNHMGIFYNCFKLRQDVEFLEITKMDE